MYIFIDIAVRKFAFNCSSRIVMFLYSTQQLTRLRRLKLPDKVFFFLLCTTRILWYKMVPFQNSTAGFNFFNILYFGFFNLKNVIQKQAKNWSSISELKATLIYLKKRNEATKINLFR